jgi:ABC-type amino acid transport substrate-binding protein
VEYVHSHASAVRLAGPRPFASGQDYGIGLPKKATALRAALVAAVKKIMASGQYAHILKKWNVSISALSSPPK